MKRLLDNKYAQDINIEGVLRGGCQKLTQWINISVNGGFFICCNDYYQRSIYANIKDGSIDRIINSTAAILNRQFVFNSKKAPQEFLCRHCDIMKNSVYLFDKGERYLSKKYS